MSIAIIWYRIKIFRQYSPARINDQLIVLHVLTCCPPQASSSEYHTASTGTSPFPAGTVGGGASYVTLRRHDGARSARQTSRRLSQGGRRRETRHNFIFMAYVTPCGLRGCKNRPTPFPGLMS